MYFYTNLESRDDQNKNIFDHATESENKDLINFLYKIATVPELKEQYKIIEVDELVIQDFYNNNKDIIQKEIKTTDSFVFNIMKNRELKKEKVHDI
jgi:hypothetical protein